MSGKGSAPRQQRNDAAYADAWDRIFGNKKESDPLTLAWNDYSTNNRYGSLQYEAFKAGWESHQNHVRTGV